MSLFFPFPPHEPGEKTKKSNISTNGHCKEDSGGNQEQTSTVAIDQSPWKHKQFAEPNTNILNESPDGQASTWRNSLASMTVALIMLMMSAC